MRWSSRVSIQPSSTQRASANPNRWFAAPMPKGVQRIAEWRSGLSMRARHPPGRPSLESRIAGSWVHCIRTGTLDAREKGERRSVEIHKRLLYCVKINRTSLDHLLLGKCADVDRSLSHDRSITRRLFWANMANA